MKYRWKTRYFEDIDPQKAGDRLERLRKRANGPVSASMVVIDARAKSSPLHRAFEWDDTVAGERYREQQARTLIANLVVVVDQEQGLSEPRETRAFVHLDRSERSGYESTARALSDAESRELILAQAFRELEGWKRKYRELEELADLFAAIDETARELNASK